MEGTSEKAISGLVMVVVASEYAAFASEKAKAVFENNAIPIIAEIVGLTILFVFSKRFFIEIKVKM